VPLRTDLSLVVASLVVAGLIAIAAFILERRVRGIEVVA